MMELPLLLWSAFSLAAEPSGVEILDRSIEAHGGLAAFRAIRSWHIVAHRPGDETYEEYLLSDGRIKTILIKRRPDGRLVFLHDGKDSYSFVDGRRREDEGAAGEAYYRAHGEYYLRAIPFKWKDPGVRATYEGETMLQGRAAYVIRIDAEPGTGVAWKDVWRAVIDKESYLLLEARLSHDRAMQTWMSPPQKGVSEIQYRFADHRAVGRLRLPYRMEYWASGKKTGENVIHSFEIDPVLDPELFRPGFHVALPTKATK